MDSAWRANIYSCMGRPKRPVHDYSAWWRRLLALGVRMFRWMAFKMPPGDRGQYLLAARQLEGWRLANAPVARWVESDPIAMAYNITVD